MQVHGNVSDARKQRRFRQQFFVSAACQPCRPKPRPAKVPPLGFAIAQLHGIYILAQSAEGLIVVDMHAAHERITYERLKANFDAHSLASQPLLVPLSLAVSSREADLAETETAFFQRLGFELARMGPETLLVRAVPYVIRTSQSRSTGARCVIRFSGARQYAPH
jgi:DNA mismatch repair protein MutL